jgi:hypothetical protein
MVGQPRSRSRKMANERYRCISLQTGPRTIVFGSGRDRELRLESLTPEREKEDTDHHSNANNRTLRR